MTRLTKEIKEKICRNAIKESPVNKELIEVNNCLSQLALDVYNDNATSKQIEEVEELTERAKELPFSVICLSRNAYIRCIFGGMYVYLNAPKDVVFYGFEDTPVYSAEHEFTKKFLDLDHKKQCLEDQCYSLKRSVMAILNSCTTLKKLQLVWAESVNFLDDIEVDELKTNLPAVMIEDLNKKLGIPS